MFALIRYFLKFIAATAFKDGELNTDKPTFDPAKLAGVTLLVLYIVIITYSLYKLVGIHHRVEMMCPDLVRILADEPRDDLIGKYEFVDDGKTIVIQCSDVAY